MILRERFIIVSEVLTLFCVLWYFLLKTKRKTLNKSLFGFVGFNFVQLCTIDFRFKIHRTSLPNVLFLFFFLRFRKLQNVVIKTYIFSISFFVSSNWCKSLIYTWCRLLKPLYVLSMFLTSGYFEAFCSHMVCSYKQMESSIKQIDTLEVLL